MGDFYQNGVITTLHNFRYKPLEILEQELMEFSETRKMSLILPSLFSELQGPALPNIIRVLKHIPYLSEIIIGLDGASEDEFKYAKEFFAELPQRHRILWNDGPRMRELMKELTREGFEPAQRGKGKNVWNCFGYFIASGIGESVALHDCDILTYDRRLIAKLLYPVANPNLTFRFCKGYYFRATDKLNGRVTRLLVTPLVKALKKIFGNVDYLEFIDSFRYPLAGEFSMRSDVVKNMRMPHDWGLEIGILSDVYRNHSEKRICQVDIADVYDHKHQDLSENDKSTGLSRMSIEICKTIFRKLAASGVVFTNETFRSLKSTYFSYALDIVEAYYSDASLNGLVLDRHSEEKAIEIFSQNVVQAGEDFLKFPMESNVIPSWKRINSAIPGYMDRLYEIVEEDNKL